MVLTICRHSAATPLVGRPRLVLSLSLSRASRAPSARLPPGAVPRARSARTRPPARGVRVCASRAHALTPFASLVLSPSFSSAFHLSSTPLAVRGAVLSPFEAIHFLDPLAGVAFSLISDESPGHAVRVCALRARPRTSTRFASQFQSPVPVHPPSPFR